MESIAIGSQEEMLVDVGDLLGNVSDLTATNPRYDVKNKTNNFMMQNQVALVDSVNKMRLHCLIDTVTGGLWPSGRYLLYVRFTAAPESPVLGPIEFKVNP